MHLFRSILVFFLLTSFNSFANNEPFESTYYPLPQSNILFKGGNIYDGDGLSLIHI